MIRTTDLLGNAMLIDPFSIDLVVYLPNQRNVRLSVQGHAVEMNAKVFEADVLPTIEEETKYGTLND